MISATSDSQDSTDDRLRPDGYEIHSKNHQPSSSKQDFSDDEENHDSNHKEQNRSGGETSLPGLIIVMPERRKAVASKRT